MLLGTPLFGGTRLQETVNAQSDRASHLVLLSWGRYLGTTPTAAEGTLES